MPNYRAEATTCTALTATGQWCDGESLPDAPFPICLKHAARLLRYLNSYAPNGLDDRIIVAARAYGQAQEAQEVRRRSKPQPIGQVYYLQVGKLIKIGHSDYLPRRLVAYPPDSRLLAVEPGTLSTEAQRHQQFAADLRHGNEWFAPSPALLAHIRALKKRVA